MIRHTLTDKQKRFLRSEGAKREPVVNIGKEGVTAALVQSAQAVIKKQELIKVRVQHNAPEEPYPLIEMLTERVDADSAATLFFGSGISKNRKLSCRKGRRKEEEAS